MRWAGVTYLPGRTRRRRAASRPRAQRRRARRRRPHEPSGQTRRPRGRSRQHAQGEGRDGRTRARLVCSKTLSLPPSAAGVGFARLVGGAQTKTGRRIASRARGGRCFAPLSVLRSRAADTRGEHRVLWSRGESSPAAPSRPAPYVGARDPETGVERPGDFSPWRRASVERPSSRLADVADSWWSEPLDDFTALPQLGFFFAFSAWEMVERLRYLNFKMSSTFFFALTQSGTQNLCTFFPKKENVCTSKNDH